MKVTPFRVGEPKTFTTLLCDGYLVENATSLRALLDLMAQKAALHPGKRLLTTLDFADQAFYTSGHAIDKHELDDTTGHDLSKLDPAAFEKGVHRGYLTTASEFSIRHANLMRKSEGVGVAHLEKTLVWEDVDLEPFLALNANPDGILDQKEIYIQAVPVTHAWEAVTAFPNGYFVGDFEPMDTVAISRHLEETYGYELFGIGAAYVGYLKRRPLDAAMASRLAAEILGLFDGADDPALPEQAAALLQSRDWLIIPYTGA